MKPGSILLVKFPFTLLETTKKRPVLLLSRVQLTEKIQLLTIAMITSRIDGLKLKGDAHLRDWKRSNLLHESLVRLSKLTTVEKELVDRELGFLSVADTKEVRKCFRQLYEGWC